MTKVDWFRRYYGIFLGGLSHGSHEGQAQAPLEDGPQAPLEGRLQGQEQVRAGAEEERWSQEGESDGGRCERH
jgi:hypothetical protein